MNEEDIPKPSLRLYPKCPTCQAFVDKDDQICGAHPEGKAPSWEAAISEMIRQVWSSVHLMNNCQKCRLIPLNKIRCPLCTWTRGAAMGIAGILESQGLHEKMVPYMDLIAIREETPGEAHKEMGRRAREPW